MKTKKIYLDHAATTPVDREVWLAMKPYFSQKFGNAMSLHFFGQEARQAIEQARLKIASFLNCQPSEIIFTSGATESNNLAIKGVVERHWAKFNTKPHLITSNIEHHCVLESCESLQMSGCADVTFISANKEGIVKPSDVLKAIQKNTILVSIMYVNNEIGTIQPVSEIGKLLEKHNKKKKKRVYFHSDATQALNYLDCDVKKLAIDMLAFSGHKIYGPKGIGALFVKKGTPIKRIQDGGEQEFGMRSGTHNVPGIVGLGKAVEILSKFYPKNKEIQELRDEFVKKILNEIPNAYVNGSLKERVPGNINLRFDNVEGESLVLMLSKEGVAASTGSACSSASLAPSHVLMSIGLNHLEAHGSLRLTLGRTTSKKDMVYAFSVLKRCVEKIRKISGNILSEIS